MSKRTASNKKKSENIDTGFDLKGFSQDLEKEFKNTLFTNEEDLPEITGYISSGSTILDIMISNKRDGGFPIGRFSEVIGTESTGKSLIAYHAIKDVQQKGGIALYIDTESATDFNLLKRLGIKVDDQTFYYAELKTTESVFKLMDSFVQQARKQNLHDTPILIVWDSIAQTSNEQEQQKEYGEATMAVNARLIAEGIRKLNPQIKGMNVCFLFTNQLKYKMATFGFGDNMTTPGGMAMKYAASVRVKLTKDKRIKKKLPNGIEEVIGVGANAEVVKNKIAPPHRKCKFNIYFNYGIDDFTTLQPYLKTAGILKEKTKQTLSVQLENGEWQDVKKSDWRKMVKNNPLTYSYLRSQAIEQIVLDYDIDGDDDLESLDFDSLIIEDDHTDAIEAGEIDPKDLKKAGTGASREELLQGIKDAKKKKSKSSDDEDDNAENNDEKEDTSSDE